ncbi:hypothetical protein [Streptomyces sp. NPDC007369]|uniref:WD40 repeat domain-containing protein n=1 Tax=Streptomyces sp. NPDC007369 TaxID=3154589 RepID=UPI0033DC39B2
MTGVRLTDLYRLLEGQVGQLTAAEWAAGPETLPQQLLHQDRTSGRAAGALAELMTERLRRAADATGCVGLATRWSTARGRRHLRTRSGTVTALAASADGAKVVVGQDAGLWRWQADSRDPALLRLGWVDALITGLHLSADGLRAVTADASGAVHLWELSGPDGAEIVFLGRHRGPARGIAVTEDGAAALSAGDDGRLLRWELPAPGGPVTDDRAASGEGLCLADLESSYLSAVVVVGDHAVVGTSLGRLFRCELGTRADPVLLGPPTEGSGFLTLAAAPSRGEVVSLDPQGVLRAWTPADPARAPREVGRHDKRLWPMAVTPEERHVIAGAVDGQVLAWPLDGPGKPLLLKVHERAVTALACHAGPRPPAAAAAAVRGAPRPGGYPASSVVSGGRDGIVLRWQPADGGAGRPTDRTDTWCITAVDPDRRVITGGRSGVHRWDLRHGGAGPRPERISGAAVRDLLLLGPDGPLVGITSDNKELYLLPSVVTPFGAPRRLTRTCRYEALAALPGGTRFLAATDDGHLELWEVQGETATVESLGMHGNRPLRVRAVAAAPDGLTAATTGQDRLVVRWDVEARTHQVLGRLDSPGRALAFAPQGDRLYAGDRSGSIRCLPLRPNQQAWEVGRHGPRSVVRSLVPLPQACAVAATAEDWSVTLWPDMPSGEQPTPLTRLAMTGTPLRLLANTGGLLVTGFDGGLTQLDVVSGTGRATSTPGAASADGPAAVRSGRRAWPSGPHTGVWPPLHGTRVAVVDLWWVNQLQPRADLAALQDRMAADGAATTVLLCGNRAGQRRFRDRMEHLGWIVRTAPPDQAARRTAILDLLREAASRGCRLVLVSGDLPLLNQVHKAGLNPEVQRNPVDWTPPAGR